MQTKHRRVHRPREPGAGWASREQPQSPGYVATLVQKGTFASLEKEHDHHLSLLQRFPLVQPILAKNMGLLRSLRGEESNANHMASETCGFPLHFWMSPVSGKEKFLFI